MKDEFKRDEVRDLRAVVAAAWAEVKRLRAGLDAAARSLRALSRAGARDANEYLQDLNDVRGYAASRAKAAEEVLRGQETNT